MKEIPLTQGKVALVSDEDYERVAQFKWTAHRGSAKNSPWYAVRNATVNGKRVWIRMHRFIMDLESGSPLVPDHLDGDGLNNQRENLEVVTNEENYRRSQEKRKKVCEPWL